MIFLLGLVVGSVMSPLMLTFWAAHSPKQMRNIIAESYEEEIAELRAEIQKLRSQQ